MLEEAGYVRLRENEEWKLVKGGKYYTERNDSSVIAFAIPTETVKGFHMAAAHSDSPCFKVKEKPELTVEDHYTIGGLGGAVAEVLAESGIPCKFKRLGIPQKYAGFGSPESLYRKYGYDVEGIVNAVRSMN